MLIDRNSNEVVRDQLFGRVQLVLDADSGELFFARVSVKPVERQAADVGDAKTTTVTASQTPKWGRMFGPATSAVEIYEEYRGD